MITRTIKILVFLVCFGGVFGFSVRAQNQQTVANVLIKDRPAPGRTLTNNAFSVGEKLLFDIYWEIAKVGNATLSVNQVINYNGKGVYEVESRAWSNRVISSFYKVDDRVTTYIDTAGIFSHRLEKHLREGKYRADRLFQFDQENSIVISRRDTVAIPEFCQDILSAFYYVRTLALEIGSTYEIPNYDNGKVYYLTVDVLKKQTVRVPAGTFDCLVIEPRLKGEGLFKHEGRIKIYLTDDEQKLPVLMTSKIVFGEVAAKLKTLKKSNRP